jgi:hypothetical protein
LPLSKGNESKSSQTVISRSAGGVPDRDSPGGPNKNKVVMSVTPDEVSAFKKGIA